MTDVHHILYIHRNNKHIDPRADILQRVQLVLAAIEKQKYSPVSIIQMLIQTDVSIPSSGPVVSLLR